MRIEAYFQQIQQVLNDCPVARSFDVTYDKRSTYEGFIRGAIHFVDGSILHLREFVDVETTIECLTYVYQYMDSDQRLIFRYDNTGSTPVECCSVFRLISPLRTRRTQSFLFVSPRTLRALR